MNRISSPAIIGKSAVIHNTTHEREIEEGILAGRGGIWLIKLSYALNPEAVEKAIADEKVFEWVTRIDRNSPTWTIIVGKSAVSFIASDTETDTIVKFTLTKRKQLQGNDFIILAVIQPNQSSS